jgi:predicted transcriptional regulator
MMEDQESTQERILRVTRDEGLIHKSELCRQTGKGWGTVGYHVNELQKGGLLETENVNGLTWLFNPGFEAHDRDIARALYEKSSKRLVLTLGTYPGATPLELSAKLEISVKTIRRHLATLENVGIISKQGLRPQRFRIIGSAKNWLNSNVSDFHLSITATKLAGYVAAEHAN